MILSHPPFWVGQFSSGENKGKKTAAGQEFSPPTKEPQTVCSSSDVVTVDIHTAKDLIRSGHRYLDVRTVEEFNNGHLENALNVPYLFITPEGKVKNPKFLEHVSVTCQKDDHILVGCQSGVRSVQASLDLLNAGFKHVKNMGGGYVAWLEKGFTVMKPHIEL